MKNTIKNKTSKGNLFFIAQFNEDDESIQDFITKYPDTNYSAFFVPKSLKVDADVLKLYVNEAVRNIINKKNEKHTS